MKKWIVLIAVLAAATWGLARWKPWQAALNGEPKETRAVTAPVETRSIHFAVNAAGDIGPAEQVSVRPEVNGKIEVLKVDVGDTAKQGDLLFSLDDKDLQIERESKDKEIERRKLELGQAERNYLRSKQLFEERLISEELFEDTRTLYELAKNALQQSEKSLELIRDRLRKTRIIAPFDCTVLTRPVSVGQAVSGSGGFNSGTEVLTIANLNEMVINAHINQADVTRLRNQQEVEVAVEAVPGLKVKGVVERIAPQATIKNNIKGFATRILLRDVDKRIRPGMTANIQIPVVSADNVVSVPLAAVFTELNPATQAMERFVYVRTGSGDERRLIDIGVADAFYAEVTRGLKTGEIVVTEFTKEELKKLTDARTKEQQPAGGTNHSPAPRPRT